MSRILASPLAGTARSSYTNIMDWATTALNPDFFVTGNAETADEERAVPDGGVGEVRLID